MGRPLRITLPNLPFHILNRGNNKQVVFRDKVDFIYYLELLKRYKKEFRFKLYHLSLMPNHVHLQMEPVEEGSLSRIMHRLTLAHTWYFNKKYHAVGHVWQGRFKSSLIDKDDYFLQCGLYIELNAKRARLVEKPEDWSWSSYKLYAFGKTEPLVEEIIDLDPFYLGLADDSEKRQRVYRRMVEEAMKEDFLKKIRKGLDEGVFGASQFIDKAKIEFKIKSLKPRGRPAKVGK